MRGGGRNGAGSDTDHGEQAAGHGAGGRRQPGPTESPPGGGGSHGESPGGRGSGPAQGCPEAPLEPHGRARLRGSPTPPAPLPPRPGARTVAPGGSPEAPGRPGGEGLGPGPGSPVPAVGGPRRHPVHVHLRLHAQHRLVIAVRHLRREGTRKSGVFAAPPTRGEGVARARARTLWQRLQARVYRRGRSSFPLGSMAEPAG